MSKCPIPNCTGHTDTGRTMCLEHWRQVPHQMQARIWSTYRAIKHMRGIGQDDKLKQLAAHDRAKAAAIDVVMQQAQVI